MTHHELAAKIEVSVLNHARDIDDAYPVFAALGIVVGRLRAATMMTEG